MFSIHALCHIFILSRRLFSFNPNPVIRKTFQSNYNDRFGLKILARMFTQEKLDLKSEIIDYPILKKFEEVSGIEIDWNKLLNRREFRAYIRNPLNMENQ